jgi:ketosteroid isomerase-like protein
MEAHMGEAREVVDRVTAAMTAGDREAVVACYAVDAVAITPDAGELTGREAISEYLAQLAEAFPDFGFEYLQKHDSGNVAIDEGYVTGTNTGSLQMPTGETLPATGNQIRIRSCDVATVEGGAISTHRFYFDQMEFLDQLGLQPDVST